MIKMEYKTKGTKSSLQSKQKVYFTCHPEDFDKCFERISDQILSIEDCVIWYLPEGEEYEEVTVDLDGMCLFVIPITTKLLTTPNRTISIDLPFALENHIPMLPLMQESGLDELFARYFGDLQYLDENNCDATTISYEEKLKKYISSIIVGDELAKKIREAFDAYIFLSYRKKDRKYAQKLMRLIHANDFCRDIAIWYDEFLVPGENFNEAIADALKKSEIFALVVTPNLVNEKNYVMMTEYPMASEAHKKVLPAELEETDKKALAELYPNIPDCVEYENVEALSNSLKNALNTIALRENDSDPKHNFFIGLAYLVGIDVEVDHGRAIELITFSAEAGLSEAIEKLVSLYQTGEAVERNYRTAISWQKKLVEVYEKAYLESKSNDDGVNLLRSLWNLGDYNYDVRDLNEAESAFLRMKLYSEKLNYKRYLSVSYNKLGDICKAKGDLQGAEEYYIKSLELREQLAKETGTVEARRGLSIGYERLGDICKAKGDLQGAEEYYMKDLELSKQLAKETGTVEERRGLSISYNKLGNICEAKGDLQGAEEYYMKALELSKQLAKETGTVEARRDLSISYNKLGDICKAKGDLQGAEEYYMKDLELSKQLANETGAVQVYDDLGVSYFKLAILSSPYDSNWLMKAHRVYVALAGQYPDVMRFRKNRDTIAQLILWN